jgi:hypothetical protein
MINLLLRLARYLHKSAIGHAKQKTSRKPIKNMAIINKSVFSKTLAVLPNIKSTSIDLEWQSILKKPTTAKPGTSDTSDSFRRLCHSLGKRNKSQPLLNCSIYILRFLFNKDLSHIIAHRKVYLQGIKPSLRGQELCGA